MSIIKIKKRENPYASIDKSAIMDTRLSWKARGLLCYLLAMPNNWRANVEHLVTQGIDKRHAVREGLNELRALGYAELVKTKDESGKLSGSEWHIFEEPKATEEKPDNRKNRESENPTFGKSNTNNNRTNNTISNKKEESKSAPSNAVGTHPVVLEVIEMALGTSTSKPKQEPNKQTKETHVITPHKNEPLEMQPFESPWDLSQPTGKVPASARKESTPWPAKTKFVKFSESLSSPTAATEFKEFLQTYAGGAYKHADAAKYIADALTWATNTPKGVTAKYADWRVALAKWCQRDGVTKNPVKPISSRAGRDDWQKDYINE